jgi:NAD(P)H dehydrogenase (quinone)
MIVLFGATGRVGGAAASELRRRGVAVRAVTREVAKGGRLAAAGCEVVAADLYDERTLRLAMDGADGVLFVCPLPPGSSDVLADAERILDAAASAITATRPRFVVAISDYGAQHPSGTGITTIFHRLEARLGQTSVPTTFVRSAEHMQNWMRYAPLVRDRGMLPSMHHPTTKPFPTVSACDVGVEAANILAAGAGGPSVVHVEGPTRYSAIDVAAAFASVMGRPVTAEALPRDAWGHALRDAGLGASYARLVVELQDAHNAGRIDDEKGVGELRRGGTTLAEALATARVR